MEAARMKPAVTLSLALLTAGVAQAGDVYVTRDAQGIPVYTDTPQTVPAQKLDIHSSSTDPATVAQRYQGEMKQYAASDQAETKADEQAAAATRATEMSAEDKAKRCTEARERYQKYMDAHRLYETGEDGERRYLDSAQIDAARASARQVMEDFCGGQ
jgi:hypothetical protein